MASKKKEVKKEVQANTLTIATETFKALVSKAYKGVGNNKLLPLTQLMCIQVKDNKLTLIVSDASSTNYLYVTHEGVAGEFYATVMADQFAKLIEKLTCETVTITVEADKLIVTGNGKYTIALQYDEMGDSIQYPDPLSELDSKKVKTTNVDLAIASKIVNSLKSSLSASTDEQYLTGYYLGDITAASNEDEMSIYGGKLTDSPMIAYPIVFELLTLSTDAKFSIERHADGIVVFRTSDIVIYSHEVAGIEDYPVEALKSFYEVKMPATCKILKSALLQALDRIALFVGTYDDNAIKLSFTGKSLKIQSLASTGVEEIAYTSLIKKPFECMVDLQSFMKHIKTQSTDTVEIQFGDDSAVKLIDSDIMQIMSLFEDTPNTAEA
jgi:DNA polymerase III sliding clamp (beta) subunit (PCNA family)